jgi:hypothetical protein
MAGGLTRPDLAAVDSRIPYDAPPGDQTTDVSDRIVNVPAGQPAAPAVTHEDIVALKLAALAQAGDSGGVRQFVHELEHELGPWRVDPWKLHVAAADLSIRRLPQAGD